MKSSQPAARKKRDLNWEVIHERILEIGDHLAHADETDLEAMEVIWKQRAEQLARVNDQELQDEQIVLVLVRVGNEIYGLDAQYVSSIRPQESITRVPRTPAWLAGVVNVRGRILAAIQLQKLFHLPGNENPTGTPFLVLVETRLTEAALVVQDVLDIKTFFVSKIQSGGAIRGINPEYVNGVILDGESDSSTIIYLNLATILADKQLVIREEIV